MNTDINKNIKRLIEKLGITPYEFSKQIGNKRADNIYNVINEKVEVSTTTINKIFRRYPEYKDFLLNGNNGEGDMFKSGNIGHKTGGDKPYSINQKGVGVPYYDVDFIGGFDLIQNDQTIAPAHYINFPHYAKADCWVNVTGHSMEPLINHGDMIAVRELKDWNTYLLYGEVYGIVTDEYRTIKYVRKSKKGDDYFLLVPVNEEYDEQDIPKKIVRSVFQMLGCAKRIF